jgi:hypothetical protein
MKQKGRQFRVQKVSRVKRSRTRDKTAPASRIGTDSLAKAKLTTIHPEQNPVIISIAISNAVLPWRGA